MTSLSTRTIWSAPCRGEQRFIQVKIFVAGLLGFSFRWRFLRALQACGCLWCLLLIRRSLKCQDLFDHSLNEASWCLSPWVIRRYNLYVSSANDSRICDLCLFLTLYLLYSWVRLSNFIFVIWLSMELLDQRSAFFATNVYWLSVSAISKTRYGRKLLTQLSHQS